MGGSSDELQPDVFKVDLESDDRLLLCTDGMTKHVPDSELLLRLRDADHAQETCRKLIELANSAGGTDNVTVIVAKF